MDVKTENWRQNKHFVFTQCHLLGQRISDIRTAFGLAINEYLLHSSSNEGRNVCFYAKMGEITGFKINRSK